MSARLLLLLLVFSLWISPTPAAATKDDAVFGLVKVWPMHLTIRPEDWKKMQPSNRGGPFGGFGPATATAKDKPADRNADRKPRGLFGLDFEYVKATLEVGGKVYPDVGVRFKGSGTYISAQGLKRPFKIDLERYVEGQEFFGLHKLTLNNSAMDPTAVREVLAYPVYRALGVPAPRTAYAALSLTIPGKYDREFVGLYVLAESIDKDFLKDHFGSAKGMLLKPERVGPLEYLGEEWPAYEPRYQPKTKVSKKAQRRLIEFTRLVQKADDATFARQIHDYLDVDRFLRFLAATVALSSMDSFVGMGRNYYLYLDPKTDRFVFLPWDVDLAFGAFVVVGTHDALVDLSIRRPQAGNNRLIERLLADEKAYAAYAKHLEFAVTKALTVEGLEKDLQMVRAVIDPIREKEKKAAAARREPSAPVFGGMFDHVPGPDVFLARRIASVKAQLAGKSKGTQVRFGFGPPPGGFKPPPGGFGPGQFLAGLIFREADRDKNSKLSKDEARAAVKALFKALDRAGKGELDQKAVAAGLDALLPGPKFPGGRPPQGFPTMGEVLAGLLLQRAGKDGKLTEAGLLGAAEKLFPGADKNDDGALEELELAEAINKLLPPPRLPGPGQG